jgi:hypothetical protein
MLPRFHLFRKKLVDKNGFHFQGRVMGEPTSKMIIWSYATMSVQNFSRKEISRVCWSFLWRSKSFQQCSKFIDQNCIEFRKNWFFLWWWKLLFILWNSDITIYLVKFRHYYSSCGILEIKITIYLVKFQSRNFNSAENSVFSMDRNAWL